MTGDKHEVSSAREAADALRRVTSRVKDSSAGEIDARSAEALDELVRLADLLGRTVEDVAGGDVPGRDVPGKDVPGKEGAGKDVADEGRAVRAYADELAAAIAAHRASLER